MILQTSTKPVQAVNDLGDLLFFALLIATAVLAVTIVFGRMRGRSIRRPAIAIVIGLATYGILLLAISFSSQPREVAPGTDKCFDDWCATVSGVRSLPDQKTPSGGKLVAVSFRVSNRAQRAAFHPSQPRVALVVPDGRVFIPSAAGQREFEQKAGPQDSLARRVMAGEQFQTSLVFEVPSDTREAWVLLLEGPPVITRFAVGDENSFFHQKIVFPIGVD